MIYKKTCPICGTEFEASHPRIKYCCRACTKIANRQSYKKYTERCKMENQKKNPVKRVCPICGTEFEPRSHNHIYCSDQCKWKARNTKISPSPKRNPDLTYYRDEPFRPETYAEQQKKETLSMIGEIVVPEGYMSFADRMKGEKND